VGYGLTGSYCEAMQMAIDGHGVPVISGPQAQLRTITKQQRDPQDPVVVFAPGVARWGSPMADATLAAF